MSEQQRCSGAQDENGPICEGPDIRLVRATGPENDFKPFETHWCSDCREVAVAGFGYKVEVL